MCILSSGVVATVCAALIDRQLRQQQHADLYILYKAHTVLYDIESVSRRHLAGRA